ncbi:hypothetical protein GL270_21185 [Aeromonas veronii]|uniref:hypothetical protein n=1 Tax=Aeromonas veronii TaxID=654 RepID=UPI001C5AD66F|nr:hypothetical protein [Aeromonas veronii]MBW3783716.1 hypothetical protein [Aeromonas veronii]
MNQKWQGFANLNLSGVEEEQGSRTLQPGEHVCRISSAKLEKTASGSGIKLVLQFDGLNGGYVRDVINVFNPSEKATEIGRKRLKHLLLQANHPNPDQPGDVATMVGLIVGVHVVKGEDWRDDSGQLRSGGGEPRNFAPYFKASQQGQPSVLQPRPAANDAFMDEIPF